jgi:hypothetical protein
MSDMGEHERGVLVDAFGDLIALSTRMGGDPGSAAEEVYVAMCQLAMMHQDYVLDTSQDASGTTGARSDNTAGGEYVCKIPMLSVQDQKKRGGILLEVQRVHVMANGAPMMVVFWSYDTRESNHQKSLSMRLLGATSQATQCTFSTSAIDMLLSELKARADDLQPSWRQYYDCAAGKNNYCSYFTTKLSAEAPTAAHVAGHST